MKKYLLSLHFKDKSIGYVPTMGALHEGHLKLMKWAVKRHEIAIASIFVNPTQFNENKDFVNYPIQVDEDIQKTIKAGVDILYLPSVYEVYPEGIGHLESYDFGRIESLAEGAHRPGHFQGVGQVLSRFLSLIAPEKMYMGQKDYQQLLITRKLVQILKLNVEVVGVPIVREPDGLAMSSRNMRLSEQGRKMASIIYSTLIWIKDRKEEYSYATLLNQSKKNLEDKGLKVEYLILANTENLEPENEFKDSAQVLLIAAWLDGVRLIDNIMLKR